MAARSWPGANLIGLSGLPRRAAVGQLIGGAVAVDDQAVLGPDGGQLGEFARDLLPHPAEGDAEDPLAARQEVVDLVRGGALVDADAVAHERDLGQVVGAAIAQVLHGRPDLLQRDPRVKQPLDHLEHEDVTEAVEPLGTRAVRRADAGLDEAGPRPVVELAVGDPGRRAGRWAPITDLWVAIEERALHSLGPTPCYRHGHLL